MQQDFAEFIETLNRHKADFVIIGGVALAFFGFPRYTGDLDIWIQPTPENTGKVFTAIEEFFDTRLNITPDDFLKGHNMITLGEEPVQIQLHLKLDGVTAADIWDNRISGKFGPCNVFYIGKNEFIRNKLSVGRPQDLVDIEKITNI